MGNCWSFQSNPKYFPSAILDAHNYFRAHHLSPPLELDIELCKEASMHANLCAFYKKELKSRRDKERGENIYVYPDDDANEAMITKDSLLWTLCYRAVNNWYETIKFHTFSASWEKNAESTKLCHMLWKESKLLGVGFARTIEDDKKKRKTFIVCLYDPPPNQKKIGENVLLPARNYIPACKIEEDNPKNEPQRKVKENDSDVQPYSDLRKGWGFNSDLSNAPDWKSYFARNGAESAYVQYVEFKAAQLGRKGNAKSVPPPGESNGNEEKSQRRRRKREVVQLQSSAELVGKETPLLPLTLSEINKDEIGRQRLKMHLTSERVGVEGRALFPGLQANCHPSNCPLTNCHPPNCPRTNCHQNYCHPLHFCKTDKLPPLPTATILTAPS